MGDGSRGAACAKDQGAGVMGLQQRAQTVAETYDIGVVAYETVAGNLDGVDGTYGASLGGDVVEVCHHGLFVGDGDVEATQVGMPVKDGGEGGDVRELEVEVLGINALTGELVREKGPREAVAEGIAKEAVLVHI